MTVDLRLGRWQDALADVGEVDAVITDPPYSERTHAGHGNGAAAGMDDRGADYRRRTNGKPSGGTGPRQSINYTSWSSDDAASFVSSWSPRCRGWLVVLTDHVLAPVFAEAMEAAGRYVFAPLPIVETGSRVRLTGDGPSSWTCWIIVGRPRTPEFVRWGTLPGAYLGSGKGDREHIGGKDSTIMRAIVRDYSRPGDLVCDPCAGAGTTLLAARLEGRRAIGAEMDPATCDKARRRLAHLPLGTEAQPGLFDG